MPKFYAQMKQIINDPKVELVPDAVGRPWGKPSSMNTDMFRTLETAAKKIYPGAITLPGMLTGATDMAQLRAKGVNAYGFGPVIDEKDRSAHGPHSDDERLQESALYKMVEFLWAAVIDVAATK
jgi:acetylornithine deacetylase/succinyl-diaminopimelate desuccinylase-like protein